MKKHLKKGLLVAVLLAIPATAWASTTLAAGGCCPLCSGASANQLGATAAVHEGAREELDAAMGRLADGDRDAFAAVFAALRPHVGRLCERMLGRGADADDASQQALEKVFARASTFRKGQSALPWALAIAAWECRTLLRRRQRTRASGDEGLAAAESPSPPPEQALLARELEACIRGALGQLSERDRATLSVTFGLGARSDDDVSGATFRKRRERALERLRLLWRRIDGDT